MNYDFITDDEIVIEIKSQSKLAQCPRCGKTTDKTHQNHWYMVRDIPMSGYQVILKVNRRQLKCTECQKVFREKLSFVKTRTTYTTRLGMKVIKEVFRDGCGDCS
ncbi:MAG: transposase family protein [Trichormus sp.]